MKNRKLILIVSLVLAMAMSLGGTLAYLQDTDADVNTMVLGNVTITQNEQERNDAGELVPFTQDKPMLPAVYEGDNLAYETDGTKWPVENDTAWKTLVDNVNVLDKFVTVTNTGNTPAYVRTLIAFEGTMNDVEVEQLVVKTFGKDVFTAVSEIEIHGKTYTCYDCTYLEALGANETSTPSLKQVYLKKEVTHEDLKTLDVNGNGTYDILVISQAVQASGFTDNNGHLGVADDALIEAFGYVNEDTAPEWFEKLYNADGTVNQEMIGTPGDKWPNNNPPSEEDKVVKTAAELQAALDAATVGKNNIVLAANIEGNVTVSQKPGVEITIEGWDYDFNGVITVDGKSGTFTTAGLTIKNVDFVADAINADACIRLGDGTTATRYTCNVTVENCTFDVPGAVGVKSYTGGDKNVKIIGCEATANAHSLCQLKGVDGVLVEDCEVYAVRGANFNNSDNVTVNNCTIAVQKYALRFGESGNAHVEKYTITNNELSSANEEDDAVIVFRAGAVDAEVIWGGNTIVAAKENMEYAGNSGVTFKDVE